MINDTYQPHELESSLYQRWEEAGYFQPKPQGKPYTIVIPPPNVTGTLHMGHGFQHTIMDALIRYHRMCGQEVLWQPGTDHAGIATQMVVERNLKREGEPTRHELGREAFLERVWAWKESSGGQISEQIRRMGSSPDWSRDRFTMDEGLSEAVREVFIRLYDEGLIYRGQRLVNWDPVLRTAISDLEVVSEEEAGFMWHIRYPLVDGSGSIVVATTRPETLLGDVAVAVNPNDERYAEWIGQRVALPLTGREIPIIADEYVDKEFGSGAVKITPAHDFNDYAVAKRHDLPLINILNDVATLNDQVPLQYQGLDRFVAREKVIQDLTTLGLLVKTEPHTLKVPRGDRSQTVIEPYLTDQWFVKVGPLAEPAIDAVKNGEIQFIPDTWAKTYFQWMENIEDWCISRQLWWGHRIPAWYDEGGKIYVGQTEALVREKYGLSSDFVLTQDEDVLDTWFSSALWPFATLGWPRDEVTLKKFYPTDVLVTGFDIIFFWVARMIMFGLKFAGDIPFKHVYITGLIRDSEGQKMSKSKGNILDPIDLIDGIDLDSLIKKRTYGLMQPEKEKQIVQDTKKQFPDGIPSHGTDALRFTFCALASHGRDIRFDLGRLEGYRHFCNKLWNAARYVLMNTQDKLIVENNAHLNLPDRWIESRLSQVAKDAHRYFSEYRFDFLAQLLYEFTWYESCDWYLELSKVSLAIADSEEKKGAIRYHLLRLLETICRLLHPIMPFITEAIWLELSKLIPSSKDSIMLVSYPSVQEFAVDDSALQGIRWLQDVVALVRQLRLDGHIPLNKKPRVLLSKGSAQDRSFFEKLKPYLLQMAKLSEITWLSQDHKEESCVEGFVGELEVKLLLDGLINKEDERARLEKEIFKIDEELQKLSVKLSNQAFVSKAPPAVVEKEVQRQKDLISTKQKLIQQFEKLK